MSADPTIAVIIPCYNYATFLPEAVESALGQSHPVNEVIVVDDGSTDDSLAVARAFEPRVIVVHKENGGLASSRNRGAWESTCELVVFLDADDRLAPNYVERCLEVYRRTEGRRFVYTQWQEFGASTARSDWPSFDLEGLKRENFINASALLPREAVVRHPYLERIRLGWEDWDFYLTLAENGYRGVLLDEPLLEYRRHATSMLDVWYRRPVRARLLKLYIVLRHRRLYAWPMLLQQVMSRVGDILHVVSDKARRAVRRVAGSLLALVGR